MQPMKFYSIGMIVLLAIMMAFVPASLAQDDMMGSSAPVQLFADASEVMDSSSSLSRSEFGIRGSVSTSGLEPGDAYTMWIVIFNEPGNCSDGVCGEDDIFVHEDGELVIGEDGGPVLNLDGVTEAVISVAYGDGLVIDEDGSAHFITRLTMGDDADAVFGPGLLNPLSAEVHFVLRSHGPAQPGIIDEMIQSINGGCDPDPPNAPCTDTQFAVHLPPMS